MSTQHNFLRDVRKQTDIMQSDIGFLMNITDYSFISRCEKGQRKPSIEILLVYHLLFNIPIDALFLDIKDDLNEELIIRIGLLLKELSKQEQTPKVQSRSAFLASALTRLVS